MRLYSSIDAFDILVLTTEDFRADLNKIAADLRIDLRIHTLPYKTVFEAACSRLQIFGYPEVAEYKTILYLDTDIIVKGELDPLFNIPTEDRVYAIESGTIASPSFGRQFYTGWTDYAKTGFNSGTLLFPNSPKIQELFSRIWAHAMEHTADPPYCMDQPFINYHAMKDDLYDNQALNPFVSLYEDNDIVTNEATSVISHFSYPIGNFAHKYGRMTKYFLAKMWANEETANSLVGKTYNWDTAGTIIFTEAGLETKWGNGSYKILGPGRVRASWNGYNHYLSFKGPDEFLSIRTSPEDFAPTFGSLQAQTGARIYVHGDSHAMLLFKDFDVQHENFAEYGTTMHRVGRDGVIPKHLVSHNSEDSTFVFVYGEVDCRAHVKRQIEAGRTAEEVCDTLVTAYFKTIKANITTYKSIIVVGVPPPTDRADHTHTYAHKFKPELVFVGTNAERVAYTRLLNARIEAACFEYGYMFFTPFANYTRADGCLEYSLSDGCIHIGKNAEFLKTFRLLIGCPEIPLVLHTCDAYEQYWNHWYFFFKKYVTGIPKVYFLTEEKLPVFASEVTVIKTGKGEWGQRLITALEQIPEAQIFYMQEDFWASKQFNPSRYVPQFFDKKMDALRISFNSPLYSLDPLEPPLYRFKHDSDYLMTHQFSLWNRDYFRKWLRPEDGPWTNEVEQSLEIAKTAHAIYLVDVPWYEAVVRSNVLQPNGIELLERHRKEIAESFLANDWYSNFLLKIREHLARDPIESFPSWKILEWTMFTVANEAERLAIGYTGEPESLLEKNRLHHKFLWKKFGEIAATEPAGIFEFGGGYGQLRSVVYEANPNTAYAIYDFPELHAIQRQHLGGIPTTFYTAANMPTAQEKHNVFLSFWAYTECPKEVRDRLVPFLKSSNFDVLFFGLAQTFQLDNVTYLRGLASTLGYSVKFVPIDEMKSHDGQQFFCIMRRI